MQRFGEDFFADPRLAFDDERNIGCGEPLISPAATLTVCDTTPAVWQRESELVGARQASALPREWPWSLRKECRLRVWRAA